MGKVLGASLQVGNLRKVSMPTAGRVMFQYSLTIHTAQK